MYYFNYYWSEYFLTKYNPRIKFNKGCEINELYYLGYWFHFIN